VTATSHRGDGGGGSAVPTRGQQEGSPGGGGGHRRHKVEELEEGHDHALPPLSRDRSGLIN
jgi:hypothetical protein